ncbi:MAG: hypothetical protein WCK73_18505 [Deltaproteobacteria bacterium]
MNQWIQCGHPGCVMQIGHPGPHYTTSYGGAAGTPLGPMPWAPLHSHAEWQAMEAEVDRLHSELASARTVERKDLYEQIERLTRLASCLASAVKCGESWTDTLEREYRAALAQPAATGEG